MGCLSPPAGTLSTRQGSGPRYSMGSCLASGSFCITDESCRPPRRLRSAVHAEWTDVITVAPATASAVESIDAEAVEIQVPHMRARVAVAQHLSCNACDE